MCVYSLAQSCLTLCDPMDYSLPGFSVQGIFQAEHWSGLPFPSPEDLPDQGSKPRLLCLWHWQVDSSPLAPPGKCSCLWSYFYLTRMCNYMVETLTQSSIIFFITPKQVYIICFPNNEFQSFQKVLFSWVLPFSPVFLCHDLGCLQEQS